MRNEKPGHIGKSQVSSSGRRRRTHKSRSSNTENTTTRKVSLQTTATEDLVLKIDKNSVRFARRTDEEKFSSIRDRQTIKVLNNIFNADGYSKPQRKERTCPEVKTASSEKKIKETRESDQSAKGAISKTDRPIPARPSNPLRFKTELCRAHEEGGFCRFGVACTFAHGQDELRSIPRHHKYKTEQCRSYHSIGYCQYGTRCHFIHDAEDIDPVIPFTKPDSPGNYEYFGSSMNNLLESIGLNYNYPLDANMNDKNPCILEGRDHCKGGLPSPKQTADHAVLKNSLAYMEHFLPSDYIETREKFMDESNSPTSIEKEIYGNLFSQVQMGMLSSSPVEFSPTLTNAPYFPQTNLGEDCFKLRSNFEVSPKKSRFNFANKIEEEVDHPFYNSLFDLGNNNTDYPWGSASSRGRSVQCNDYLPIGTSLKSIGSHNALESRTFPGGNIVPFELDDKMYEVRSSFDCAMKNTECLSSAVAKSVISEPPELTWDLRLPMIEEFYPKSLS